MGNGALVIAGVWFLVGLLIGRWWVRSEVEKRVAGWFRNLIESRSGGNGPPD